MRTGTMGVTERNAVRVAGEGRPIVLVHGFGCDQAMWDMMLAEMPGGFQIVRYDLTGMGQSDHEAYDPVRHASLDGHATDLIEILDSLGAEPAILVGHSVSSMICGLVAARRPDLVHGLVMVCPSPRYINDGDYNGGFSAADIDGLLEAVENNYQGWAGQLAAMVAGPEQPVAESTLRNRFCKNEPDIMRHFAEVTFRSDNRDDLAAIKRPTLIIQTRNDVIVPLEVTRLVKDSIPDAHLQMVPGEGHAPHMTSPRVTAQAIHAFAAGL